MDVIWRDVEQNLFYLVPEDYPLTAGEQEIVTLLGRSMWVDAAAVMPFQVPREIAEMRLSTQISDGLEQISDSIISFFEQSARRPDLDAEPPHVGKTERTVNLLLDLMDEPAELLQTDSDAAKRGWLTLAEKVDRFLTNVKNGDEDAAKAQIEAFATTLQRHGIDVKTKPE
jgi:hypothetical protein